MHFTKPFFVPIFPIFNTSHNTITLERAFTQQHHSSTRFSNDISLTDVQFLGGRNGDGDGGPGAAPYGSSVGAMADDGPDMDSVDDLPF